ncbi:MAG TPA: methylmalonyl-CoA epimerase [Thermoplasmata archaeon]|nr:methylmalonyl-CoA epimerase [Thermoplasmata archaeon]
MHLDHLAIAVHSLADAVPRWERQLEASASPPEEVPTQRVRVAFLDVGNTHLEFLEPAAADSPIAKFLEGRKEGMHHIAFAVPSVDRKLAELQAAGVRVIDSVARPGARGRRVGFAHPSAFGGVLVEFVEGPR